MSESNGRQHHRPAAHPGADRAERAGIGIGGLLPPCDRHLRQPGGGQHPAHQRTRHAVVHGQVGLRRHAERAPAAMHQPHRALLVAPVLGQEVGRDGPLCQVVDPGEAAPLAADQFADVEQPLGGDFGLGPVPPRAALLGSAELVGRQRALAAQARQHLVAGLVLLLQHVPPPALLTSGPALEPVGRPVLERKHAGGVGPVLERFALRPPVGLLHSLRPIAPRRA